jgi:hypothetical protein
MEGTKERIRIMQQAGRAEVRVSGTSNTIGIFVPYAKDRIVLILQSHGSTTYNYGLHDDLSATEGQPMQANAAPHCFNIFDHGPIVQGPIYFRPAGGTGTFTYWEAMAPP